MKGEQQGEPEDRGCSLCSVIEISRLSFSPMLRLRNRQPDAAVRYPRSQPFRLLGDSTEEGQGCYRRKKAGVKHGAAVSVTPDWPSLRKTKPGRPGTGPELSPSGHLSPGSPRGQLSPQSGERPICTISAASCRQVTAKHSRYQRQPMLPTSAPVTEAEAGRRPGTHRTCRQPTLAGGF